MHLFDILFCENLCLYGAGCICFIPGWDGMCGELETVLSGEWQNVGDVQQLPPGDSGLQGVR